MTERSIDKKPAALFLAGGTMIDAIYAEADRARARSFLDFAFPPLTPETLSPEALADVEIILSGWGMPVVDAAFLEKAPHLRAIIYGAGSVKHFTTDAMWERGIAISSAYSMNAVPVAEFTLAQIILAAKHAWQSALRIKSERAWVRSDGAGMYGTTVGIISLGMIARLLRELLRGFDVNVIAFDPFVTKEEAARLDVELCSLDELFQRADFVTLHTPWLKETENMIRGRHFESMKEGGTFINTARGAIVNEPEMIAVLERRPDLLAMLDVTYPEPPVAGSPFYTLPNVILTPHIAGSRLTECHRMGRFAVSEAERFVKGEPMLGHVTKERAAILA